MFEQLKKVYTAIGETARTIIIALVCVVIVRTFIAQPFLVSGASMEPNFHNGNYLLIDELTYRFREPQRGEVVVFRYPGSTKEYFIKRIIGLPGETLTVAGNQITITAPRTAPITLTESYLASSTKTMGSLTTTLGPKEYFMLGDNRGNSFDSRNWGSLQRSEIIGIARLRLLPLSQMQTIGAPAY